jgi:hypothetical protein
MANYKFEIIEAEIQEDDFMGVLNSSNKSQATHCLDSRTECYAVARDWAKTYSLDASQLVREIDQYFDSL